MAVDKLVDSTQLDSDLTSVANAIRTKGGTSAQLAFPAGFVQAIADIPSGGGIEDSDFLKFHSETLTIGANTITNTSQYAQYLNSAKSIPGVVFAMSIREKPSYVYDEIGCACGVYVGNVQQAYRYRNAAWKIVSWNSAGYDAKAVEDTIVDIYTFELINPADRN